MIRFIGKAIWMLIEAILVLAGLGLLGTILGVIYILMW